MAFFPSRGQNPMPLRRGPSQSTRARDISLGRHAPGDASSSFRAAGTGDRPPVPRVARDPVSVLADVATGCGARGARPGAGGGDLGRGSSRLGGRSWKRGVRGADAVHACRRLATPRQPWPWKKGRRWIRSRPRCGTKTDDRRSDTRSSSTCRRSHRPLYPGCIPHPHEAVGS